ncbi:hypothetical protein ElyMa_004104100 [Elysia marginata]|uniref:Uncharacterized protein n=1 Tax=Elysia marginata TaxID=1093978 RepID=A0AAV4GBS0_9GAST|nr:hypothetical protein ElyMa_004104100 [Elysia marginata]
MRRGRRQDNPLVPWPGAEQSCPGLYGSAARDRQITLRVTQHCLYGALSLAMGGGGCSDFDSTTFIWFSLSPKSIKRLLWQWGEREEWRNGVYGHPGWDTNNGWVTGA